MLEMKGFAGVLYGLSEWVMRLSAVNLMWFFLCLPFFTLLMAIDMGDSAGRIWFGLTSWLLVTFLVFPATSAVFSVVRSWIAENDYAPVFKTYLAKLKMAYKTELKAGAVLAVVWLFWYFSYFHFYMANNNAAFLLLAVGLGLFVYTLNFLSISAHYRMSGSERMKNAFFISAGRPLTSLVILIGSGLLVWVSLFQLLWLFPLMLCSLVAFLAFSAFHKAAVKLAQKAAPQTPA